MKAFAFVMLLAPLAALSQGITDLQAPGSLAPTRSLGCIPLEQASARMTPPDLHTGVIACVERQQFDQAARLFMLAGAYARFDSLRVADPTAKVAGQALIAKTSRAFSKAQRERLAASIKHVMAQDSAQKKTNCKAVEKIGRPDYFPTYMIMHGANAFTAGAPGPTSLAGDFDAAGTWAKLQASYLRCTSS